MRAWISVLIVGLCGCGSSGGTSSAADANVGESVDSRSGECTRSGFSKDTDIAERDAELGVLFYTARSAAEDVLGIDFYFPLGAIDGTQTTPLTGEGLDTCGLCIIIRSDCQGLLCDRRFMAQSGQLEISAMGAPGQQLEGVLRNAVLAEVTIDAATQVTTLVEDGDTWCLADYAFDVTVTAP